MMDKIQKWSRQRSSWLLLFLSALAFELTALFFQYGMDLRPCIMCIYQRTAMFGILFAALIPLLFNTRVARVLGYVAWAVSSIWGFLLAREHVDIISAANPFIPCEIVPNFPSWMPLHEWFPMIFEANGDCLENSWQFAGMGMAEWMMVIFACYIVTLFLVLASKLASAK